MQSKNEQITELIELNNELENYFRNTIIPQLFVDADLILQKFTPPAMKQFNLTKTDVGKSITDVKENFRIHSIIDDIKHAIENKEILEKEVQTTDYKWYQMNIIPYVDIKTKITNGVIITFVEITARVNDLKQQERLISDHETLLDTISHDIKNPLTNLVLAINMFKDAPSKNALEFPVLLKIIENSVSNMQRVINELTDTRKQEYRYKAEAELINFNNILEDVRLTIYEDIKKSGVIIKSEINVPEITFSRRKLRSIIYNLISNAIKFKSPDRKPEILIKTERDKNFIVISVKDNGMGIDAGKKDAVFSKYYRVQNAIEGSGIGLYLVKEIVNNSGGKVLLESQLGTGSEFKIYLKAEDESIPLLSVRN